MYTIDFHLRFVAFFLTHYQLKYHILYVLPQALLDWTIGTKAENDNMHVTALQWRHIFSRCPYCFV